MIAILIWIFVSTLVAAGILMSDGLWRTWGLLTKCIVGLLLAPGFISVVVLSVVMERAGVWTLIEKALKLIPWYREEERVPEKGGDKRSLTPPLGRTA